MSHFELYINDSLIVTLTSERQLSFHTPPKCGSIKWKIIDVRTGEVVDQYKPLQLKKQKPITPYIGSWAEHMAGGSRHA